MKTGPGFFIALRYLLGRAREGGRYLRGAAAGIALSLIPIIVTLTVADGMIRGITDRFLELGTGHIQVYNNFDPADLGDAAALAEKTGGVRAAWPERRGLGSLAGTKGRTGATIRAVDPSFWDDEGSRRFLVTRAGSHRLESDGEVLLGEELARSLGAGPGDTIRIMTLRISPEGRNIPLVTPFTVRGIVSSGYRELDSLWCIMSYEGGKRILAPELAYSCLLVKIRDPYGSADRVAGILAGDLGWDYRIFTWKTLQRSQYSSYESTRQILLFIMALIVLVAAVNVSSATSMLATERRRDIAVLKAFGAGPGDTSRVFLWASLLTGLTGAFFGVTLGLLIGVHINPLIHGLEAVLGFFSRLFHRGEVKILDPGFYLETIPIIIDWTTVFLIGFFTVASSILASWIPSRRAGKISPVELLRKY
ncbi:MAG: ABC transporter permease [Spirochaetaceae bacterium]|nr:ABC transporter permease [Spirochaetaceae bacterium]